MKPPRGLTAEEAGLWRRVTETVKPLEPPRNGEGDRPKGGGGGSPPSPRPEAAPAPAAKPKGRIPPRRQPPPPAPTPPRQHGLDSQWERKLARALLAPDFTLDLHGHTLDQAHARLDAGLAQAKAMGARLVLVVTGKARPVEAADRGERRGAIRAKILDWLAAGPHAADIAAVRGAHRRHGGEGAIYLVLKRGR